MCTKSREELFGFIEFHLCEANILELAETFQQVADWVRSITEVRFVEFEANIVDKELILRCFQPTFACKANSKPVSRI